MSAELDAGDRPRLLSDGDVSGKRRPWMLGYGASGGLVLGFILGIVIGIVIGSMPPITQRCHQTVAMATRHDASPTARPLLPSSPPPPSPPQSSSPPPRSHAVPAPARALPPIHTDPEQRLERCKQDLLVSRAQAEDKRPPSPPPPLPSQHPFCSHRAPSGASASCILKLSRRRSPSRRSCTPHSSRTTTQRKGYGCADFTMAAASTGRA